MPDLLTPAELAEINDAAHNLRAARFFKEADRLFALLRHSAALEARTPAPKVVRIIFGGPPSHESGRFVECEDEQGRSIKAGEWRELENGLWELRIEVSNASI